VLVQILSVLAGKVPKTTSFLVSFGTLQLKNGQNLKFFWKGHLASWMMDGEFGWKTFWVFTLRGWFFLWAVAEVQGLKNPSTAPHADNRATQVGNDISLQWLIRGNLNLNVWRLDDDWRRFFYFIDLHVNKWWDRVKIFWLGLGLVNFVLLGVASVIFGLGLGSENFPLKSQIFPLRVKKNLWAVSIFIFCAVSFPTEKKSPFFKKREISGAKLKKFDF